MTEFADRPGNDPLLLIETSSANGIRTRAHFSDVCVDLRGYSGIYAAHTLPDRINAHPSER